MAGSVEPRSLKSSRVGVSATRDLSWEGVRELGSRFWSLDLKNWMACSSLQYLLPRVVPLLPRTALTCCIAGFLQPGNRHFRIQEVLPLPSAVQLGQM